MNMFAKKPYSIEDVSIYHKIMNYAEESDAGLRAVETGISTTAGQTISAMKNIVVPKKDI